MSIDFFFILGYVLLILFLWTIPFFRKVFVSHKAELFTFSSGYIFLLADIKNGNTNPVIFNKNWDELNNWLIGIGIILALVSIVMTFLEKENLKTYETVSKELTFMTTKFENVKNEYFKLCSDHIREIFNDFFAQSNGCGRVSIYKHEGENFKLLGRYSNNPTYNKPGRVIYPENEGFIAKGWENEKFEIYGIPKWTKNGSAWKTFISGKCNMSDENLRKIKMKSCSFYIYRFNNEDARNPHGIMVLEQIKKDQIPNLVIEKIIEDHEKQIKSLMKSMKSLE